MITSLINLEKIDDEMRVTSRLISERTGTTYKATNNLIRKHRERLESFGSLPFKKAAKSKSGQEKHALLNEDQAIFLITLSRNTEKVVDFKQALVTAFSKLRRKQARIDADHAKSEWQQNRELGKLERRDITDSIKIYISYAEAQGSRGSTHYYTIITKCVNRALCIEDRDEIGEEALHTLATAETVAERVLLDGMNGQLPYKIIYTDLKRQMSEFASMVVDDSQASRAT
jgi:hypothetical protein